MGKSERRRRTENKRNRRLRDLTDRWGSLTWTWCDSDGVPHREQSWRQSVLGETQHRFPLPRTRDYDWERRDKKRKDYKRQFDDGDDE